MAVYLLTQTSKFIIQYPMLLSQRQLQFGSKARKQGASKTDSLSSGNYGGNYVGQGQPRWLTNLTDSPSLQINILEAWQQLFKSRYNKSAEYPSTWGDKYGGHPCWARTASLTHQPHWLTILQINILEALQQLLKSCYSKSAECLSSFVPRWPCAVGSM